MCRIDETSVSKYRKFTRQMEERVQENGKQDGEANKVNCS